MNHAIKQIILSLLLIVVVSNIKAQNHVIDSVKHLISITPEDKDKISNLNFLSSLLSASKPLEAIEMAKKAIELAKVHHDTLREGKGYLQMAIAYMNISRYDTAKILVHQSIELCKKIDHKKLESSSLNTLGNIHLELSEKKEALSCYLNALQLAEQSGDTMNLPMRLVNIGKAHLPDKNYVQAKNYLKRAIKAAQKVNNKNAESFILLSMGQLYYQMNQIDSAKIYYEKALAVEKNSIHSQNKREILSELAQIYERMGEYAWADTFLKECLMESQLAQDYKREISCFVKLSTLKQTQKEWQSAIAYAELALQKSDSLHILEDINASYKVLSESYAGAKNFEKAYYYQQRYKITNDSIFNTQKSAQIQEMQTKYEVQQKETENTLLREKDKDNDKRIKAQRGVIAGATIIIFLIGFLSISLLRSRRREKTINQELQEKNALLEDLNIIKDKLFSIIGHDLRSPINSLKSILGLLTDKTLSEEQVRMLFSKLIKEVGYTSNLLENLLQWAKSQLQGINVNSHTIDIQEITTTTVNLLQEIADTKNIRIVNEINTPVMATGDEEMIKTVIRNLLSNALKFTNPKGEIKINCKTIDNQVEISITDNGIGIKADTLSKLFKGNLTTRGTQNEKGTGLGLLMVKDFVEKNKGSIRVESEPGKGSCFVVTLPK